MTVSLRASGTWKTASFYVRVGGVWKAATTVWLKVASVWKLVSGITAVTAAPANVWGFSSGSPVTSNDTTATVTGGSGTFSYAWSQVDGDPGITITVPNGATTTFSAIMFPGATKSGQFICTVTDTVTGQAVASNEVTVTLERVV
jgi:hypothetical protein